MKTELTPYEQFKIYLISNNLDVELAEPAAIAPSILNYPWDQLCIMLAFLHKEFRNKNTTVLVKPIYYSAMKFNAAQEDMTISDYLNSMIIANCREVIKQDIEYRLKHLALKMEALNGS